MYWRTWNKPVYQFFRRHVYYPLRSRGWNHTTASTAVFLVSAVLHELLVGVPTHNMIGKYHPIPPALPSLQPSPYHITDLRVILMKSKKQKESHF
jgi:hypothetical protein